jgi:type IV pilus assembly protein PilV
MKLPSSRSGPAAQRNHKPNKRASSERGFVLVEVLVAGLIFTFGVLGIIGLQVQMTRAQTVSKYRADAVNLTQELVGLMWSDFTDVPSFSTNCSSNPRCANWQAKVDRQLPGAQTTVQVQTGNVVSIEIEWPTVDGTQRYSTQTQVFDQTAP